ncbi:MAG: hypothetical protein JNK67_18645 [Alphaproteobacteria bacterium]|nr:hypothetical protein [Alphaproteobacteria bacterium]
MRATYAMADGACRPPGGEFTAEELRHALRCLADEDDELAIELGAGAVLRLVMTASGTLRLALIDAGAARAATTEINMPMAEIALDAAIARAPVRSALAPFFFLEWRCEPVEGTAAER